MSLPAKFARAPDDASRPDEFSSQNSETEQNDERTGAGKEDQQQADENDGGTHQSDDCSADRRIDLTQADSSEKFLHRLHERPSSELSNRAIADVASAEADTPDAKPF